MGKNYGCSMLILDVVLTVLTGGLWIIVIAIRQLSK